MTAPPGMHEAPHDMREQPRSRLGALAYRDYRLIWCGLLVSQLGQWMQFTSLTYLIGAVLANSASQSALGLGLLGAVRAIPILLLSPIAGVVADRFPRRRTLMLTNLSVAILALILAFVSQARGPWVLPAVLVIAGLFAGAQCFDTPARQSWITYLVPRSLIPNAIGLSSFARNVPLMIGPAVAGIIISTVGVYASFFVQAATQWAVVVAIACMRPAPVSNAPRQPMWTDIRIGVRYLALHPVLRWVMLMLIVSALCVRPYPWLLATFAGHVLHVGARAFGVMLAVGGVGTVCGALTTALYDPKQRGRLWFISGGVAAGGLILLGSSHSYAISLILLAFMGWGSMSFISLANVLSQMLSPEEMRGRVMAMYSMILNGLIPAGTLLLGALAAFSGLPFAYMAAGAVALIFGVWTWATQPELRKT